VLLHAVFPDKDALDGIADGVALEDLGPERLA
jgi:hypothetical protein